MAQKPSEPREIKDAGKPAPDTASSDTGSQASRGRSEYGQVGGTREVAADEGGYSRDGRQGGFGEEKPGAETARKQDRADPAPGRPGAKDALRTKAG